MISNVLLLHTTFASVQMSGVGVPGITELINSTDQRNTRRSRPHAPHRARQTQRVQVDVPP